MKLPASTIVVLTLSASLFACAEMTIPLSLAGKPAQAEEARRTIVVDDNTQWVNVHEGEVVRFVTNGREFAWSFDSLPEGETSASFELNRIAPPGALHRNVVVYVSPGLEGVSN